LRSIVTNMSVCVSLSARISPEPHARPLPNLLCLLPMSVARSSSGLLTIGRIAYRREGVDGSAQRERSVIYDCLVLVASKSDCCRLLSAVIERVVEENRGCHVHSAWRPSSWASARILVCLYEAVCVTVEYYVTLTE